jgi:hypothetical protein
MYSTINILNSLQQKECECACATVKAGRMDIQSTFFRANKMNGIVCAEIIKSL